jgi:hypothetical protein
MMPYYLHFLHQHLSIGISSDQKIFMLLQSTEVVALLWVLSILSIAVCLPTRWLAGTAMVLGLWLQILWHGVGSRFDGRQFWNIFWVLMGYSVNLNSQIGTERQVWKKMHQFCEANSCEQLFSDGISHCQTSIRNVIIWFLATSIIAEDETEGSPNNDCG